MSSSILNGEQLCKEISLKGYSEIEQTVTNEDLLTAVEAYAHFTLNHPDPDVHTMNAMLPSDNEGLEKKLDELDYSLDKLPYWHKYRTNTPKLAKPDGYTNRSFQNQVVRRARGIDLHEDPKEFYHYTPLHIVTMVRQHDRYNWGSIPPEVHSLDNAMGIIHKKTGAMLLRVLAAISETHPEVKNQVTTASLLRSPLRLLFYHIQSSVGVSTPSEPYAPKLIAGGHYDKGYITGQVGESHEGLEIAPNKYAPLTRVVRAPNKAVVFPAAGLSEATGNDGELQKAWHQVVESDVANPGRSIPIIAQEFCQRWTFVMFTNSQEMHISDKALMHKR